MLTPRKTAGDTSWFTHDRFGLFIHWGLYAQPARHEWVKSMERIPDDEYTRKYFKRFDPDLYDPNAWADAAANAGMKYFVVTTKHHEGFCLWDSKLTGFKATNTAAKRDLLKPMVDAFRKRNMKVGFYHSLLDWHHPDYTTDQHHPQRDDETRIRGDAKRKLERYVTYLHGQSRELLTKFGTVDILWYDFSVGKTERFKGKGKDEWQSGKLIKLVRSLQPKIILNDRLQIDQDVKTPEQYLPREWVRVNGQPVVWEACHTFGGSWGYHRDEESWKSVDQLVKLLIECVSRGGNLLLNVGPTGRGEFDHRALDRLKGIGEWMKRHGRSIYGCTQAPEDFQVPADCRFTYNPDTHRLYLHIFSWPYRHLHLTGLSDRIEYAQLLHDASEVRMLKSIHEESYGAMKPDPKTSRLTLELPVKHPPVTVPVIELFLK